MKLRDILDKVKECLSCNNYSTAMSYYGLYKHKNGKQIVSSLEGQPIVMLYKYFYDFYYNIMSIALENNFVSDTRYRRIADSISTILTTILNSEWCRASLIVRRSNTKVSVKGKPFTQGVYVNVQITDYADFNVNVVYTLKYNMRASFVKTSLDLVSLIYYYLTGNIDNFPIKELRGNLIA